MMIKKMISTPFFWMPILLVFNVLASQSIPISKEVSNKNQIKYLNEEMVVNASTQEKLDSLNSDRASSSEQTMGNLVGAKVIQDELYNSSIEFFLKLMEFHQVELIDRIEFSRQLQKESFLNPSLLFSEKLNSNKKNYEESLYQLYLQFLNIVKEISLSEKEEDLLKIATQIQLEDRGSQTQELAISYLKEHLNKIYAANEEQLGLSYEKKIKFQNKKSTILKDSKPPVTDAPSSEGVKPAESNKSDLKKAMEKVFSVTYQSCQVLKQQPINKLTEEVQGIKSTCCHGPGQIRSISNLNALQNTHYYLKEPLQGGQCFPIKNNPLIYDYGGRPFYTRGEDGSLDFFKNLGPTRVLGYDCSALVYSVLLGGGFRLSPNKPFVASHIVGAQSAQFINPEKRGMNCLQRITLTPQSSIKEGDIAAFNGHVVMVYSVGKDPFGIDKVESCERVSSSLFDFTLLQSSPSKNGIGVNVFEARDYLEESPSMENIFLDYAKNYCFAKKNNKRIQPMRKSHAIVRHKNTVECRTNKVSFEHESCVVGTCI